MRCVDPFGAQRLRLNWSLYTKKDAKKYALFFLFGRGVILLQGGKIDLVSLMKVIVIF